MREWNPQKKDVVFRILCRWVENEIKLRIVIGMRRLHVVELRLLFLI
jgi:hypothetical protein